MQVLDQVKKGSLTLKAAAPMIKVCYCQAKRLLVHYRKDGPPGLAHQHRGKPARNALGSEIRERVLTLHRKVNAQFNDTHFTEMLEDRRGLRIGRETVRRWLREAGIRPKRHVDSPSTVADDPGDHRSGSSCSGTAVPAANSAPAAHCRPSPL